MVERIPLRLPLNWYELGGRGYGARDSRKPGITRTSSEFLRYVRDHERPRTADLAAEFAVGVGVLTPRPPETLSQHGLAAPQSLAAAARNCSRRTNFCTLPDAVSGKASTNRQWRGVLCAASRARQ